jgi:hypothetical protein
MKYILGGQEGVLVVGHVVEATAEAGCCDKLGVEYLHM